MIINDELETVLNYFLYLSFRVSLYIVAIFTTKTNCDTQLS